MRITVDMVMDLPPCWRYPLSRVRGLAGGREWLSAGEVAMLPVQEEDLSWLFSQLLCPRDKTREVARRIARDALGNREIPQAYRAWLDTGEEALRPEALSSVCVAERNSPADELACWTAARYVVQYADLVSPYFERFVFCAARASASAATPGASVGGSAWSVAWEGAMRRYIGWMSDWLDIHGEES